MAGAERILDVNRRYHDAVAHEYDGKWGIDFGATAQAQVLGKLRKLLPGATFGRALEIGAGTGYFSLNLMLGGAIREVVCTDISPGMLEALARNAAGAGLDVETVPCEAHALPFDDESFDAVLGHAVLHHLPDVGACFGEFARVLRPGGALFFAGEPSLYGDRAAAVPKRLAWQLAPLWRRAIGVRPADSNHANGGAELEPEVDVHAFTPAALEEAAHGAGLDDVQVRGEELLANWFGWFNRSLEASARPGDLPMGWIKYAYHGYLALQQVDRRLLEPRLPPAIFYNLMVSARKPSRT
jgi:SAM-dependent methyltransferase